MSTKPNYGWKAVLNESLSTTETPINPIPIVPLNPLPIVNAADMAYAKFNYFLNKKNRQQKQEFNVEDHEFKKELVLVTKHTESPELLREAYPQTFGERRSKYLSKNLRSTNMLNTKTGLVKLSIETASTTAQSCSKSMNLTRAV